MMLYGNSGLLYGNPVHVPGIAVHLRRKRNAAKYGRDGVVSERERDRVVAAVRRILAALEEAVFTLTAGPTDDDPAPLVDRADRAIQVGRGVIWTDAYRR